VWTAVCFNRELFSKIGALKFKGFSGA